MATDYSDSLVLLVLGRPGIGKSTLVNGLIGKEVAKVSAKGDIATHGVTRDVRCHRGERNNFKIEVWDTPGLLDPGIDSIKTLEEVKFHCSHVDLILFCLNMNVTRLFDDGEESTMINMITNVLGKSIWSKIIIALLQANMLIKKLECDHSEESQLKEVFQKNISSWKSLLKKKVPVSDIDPIPVGYYRIPHLFRGDKFPWLSKFWTKAYAKLPPTKQAHLIFINQDRLVEQRTKTVDEVKEGDISKKKIAINSVGSRPDPKPRRKNSKQLKCVEVEAAKTPIESPGGTTGPPEVPPRRRALTEVKSASALAGRPQSSATLPRETFNPSVPPVPLPRYRSSSVAASSGSAARPISIATDHYSFITAELGDVSMEEETELEVKDWGGTKPNSECPDREQSIATKSSPLAPSKMSTSNNVMQADLADVACEQNKLKKLTGIDHKSTEWPLLVDSSNTLHTSAQLPLTNAPELVGDKKELLNHPSGQPRLADKSSPPESTLQEHHELPQMKNLNEPLKLHTNYPSELESELAAKLRHRSAANVTPAVRTGVALPRPRSEIQLEEKRSSFTPPEMATLNKSSKKVPPPTKPKPKKSVREEMQSNPSGQLLLTKDRVLDEMLTASTTSPENSGICTLLEELAVDSNCDCHGTETGESSIHFSSPSIKSSPNSSISQCDLTLKTTSTAEGSKIVLKTTKSSEENIEENVDLDLEVQLSSSNEEVAEIPLKIKSGTVDFDEVKEKPLCDQPILISPNLFTKMKKTIYRLYNNIRAYL